MIAVNTGCVGSALPLAISALTYDWTVAAILRSLKIIISTTRWTKVFTPLSKVILLAELECCILFDSLLLIFSIGAVCHEIVHGVTHGTLFKLLLIFTIIFTRIRQDAKIRIVLLHLFVNLFIKINIPLWVAFYSSWLWCTLVFCRNLERFKNFLWHLFRKFHRIRLILIFWIPCLSSFFRRKDIFAVDELDDFSLRFDRQGSVIGLVFLKFI